MDENSSQRLRELAITNCLTDSYLILVAYDDIDQWLRNYQVTNKLAYELLEDF